MHRALYLDEILRVIFGHCYSQSFPPSLSGPDLVALATTCQAFKEPALDTLWVELRNPTALVRCLPEVCCTKDSYCGVRTYMFKRQLNESERDVVKSYTRRIRSLLILPGAYRFDPQSVVDLFLLPIPTDPFFPNILRLVIFVTNATLPLFPNMVGPKLKSLRVHFLSIPKALSFESFFQSLGSSCPNMESIQVFYPPWDFPIEFNHIMARQFRCWDRLRIMDWFLLNLDIDTLAYLSQVHGLSKLSFTLSHASMEQITSPTHLLVFSTLEYLQMITESITDASRLFTRMLLPVVTNISVSFDIIPRHSVKSFSMALATSHSLTTLSVTQTQFLAFEDLADIALTLEDIYPLTALNLTQISIDLNQIIELRDSSLVEFASSCPQLSSLIINETFGWKSLGITPAGLAQILQICPSLSRLCIALDTHGYVPLQTQTSYARVDAGSFSTLIIDIVDSVIDAESVPALAAFFADQMLGRGSNITLGSWGSGRRVPGFGVYKKRWENVQTLAKEMVLESLQVP